MNNLLYTQKKLNRKAPRHCRWIDNLIECELCPATEFEERVFDSEFWGDGWAQIGSEENLVICHTCFIKEDIYRCVACDCWQLETFVSRGAPDTDWRQFICQECVDAAREEEALLRYGGPR